MIKDILKNKRFLIVLVILLLILFCYCIYNAIPKHNVFVRVGNMNYERSGHNSILLNDGRVFIIGGTNKTNKAEIYNPKIGKFHLTKNSLYDDYNNSTLTLLKDGRVFITAGNGSFLAGEIFNPKDESFKPVGNCKLANYDHTANILPNGKVIIIGSTNKAPLENGFRPINTKFQQSVILDPTTGKFTLGAKTNIYRFKHFAINLQNGNILILPELFYTDELTPKDYKKTINFSPPTEIYDIKTNKFNLVGKFIKPHDQSAFRNITVYFPIGDNKILIAMCSDQSYTGIAIYDYKTNKIKCIYQFINYRFYYPENPILLKNKSSIMFMGGDYGPQPFTKALKTTEIINYKTLERSKGTEMKIARYSWPSIVELKNGDILISGGWVKRGSSTNKAELYKK